MLFPSHRLLLALGALFSGISFAHGGVVTLYFVNQPTPTSAPNPSISDSVEVVGTTIASAIGPGDAGMTRYEIQQIQSKVILHGPDATVTLFSTPLTVTYTVEQGASSLYASAPPLITRQSSGQRGFQGFKQNCSLDISHNAGNCVSENQDPELVFNGDAESTSISTSTETYTGPLVPLATVVTTDVTSGADSNAKAMILRVVIALGVMMAVNVF